MLLLQVFNNFVFQLVALVIFQNEINGLIFNIWYQYQ